MSARSKNAEQYFVENENETRSKNILNKEMYAEESPAKEEKNGPQTVNGIIIGAACVNARKGPSMVAECVKTFDYGDKVPVLGIVKEKNGMDEFYEVIIGKESTAFILSCYVKLKED